MKIEAALVGSREAVGVLWRRPGKYALARGVGVCCLPRMKRPLIKKRKAAEILT